MPTFFKPFANEIEHLQSTGFVFKGQVFRAIITHAVLDLPAKAAFQQTMQYNGYFGCGYCLHQGEKTDGGVRYTSSDKSIVMRTDNDFLIAMDKISRKEYSKINGIKGISVAVSFDRFDMVKSFCLDYMHCVLLGVTKNLLEFWLGPTKKHDSYINKKNQELLNRRIRSIKPCIFISRQPRSLEQRKLFKASEFRSLLLYYLPVCLNGFIKKKYLNHLQLLSASIYKLLTTNISSQDVISVESNLNIFVKQYQDFYGKGTMTMNVHLLTHIVFCVKNLGPLWSQSMFSFESNNATFSRYVKGSTDILAQISTRYMLQNSIKQTPNSIKDLSEKFSFTKKIKLTESEVIAFRSKNILFDVSKPVKIYCVYKKNNERYTSLKYEQAKKTIDYVVRLKDSSVGKVKLYLIVDGLAYILLDQFEYGETVDHISEILPKNIEVVHLAGNIVQKFIYINFLNKHYIKDRPNPFETAIESD